MNKKGQVVIGVLVVLVVLFVIGLFIWNNYSPSSKAWEECIKEIAVKHCERLGGEYYSSSSMGFFCNFDRKLEEYKIFVEDRTKCWNTK